jgi:hypothetical protein
MKPARALAAAVMAEALLLLLIGSVPTAAAADQDWENLSPRERYEAMQNYWKHERLPEERRRDVERRYQRWQKMSPQEQQRIRRNYERFQQLAPSQRRQVERELERDKRGRKKKDRRGQ